MSKTPWAYIAHKDGHWSGVIVASAGDKSVKKFFGEFAGYSIETAYSRQEYLDFTERNPMDLGSAGK